MKNKNTHVVPHKDGWAVKRENASRPSSVHEVKSQAVERARDQAKNDKAELFIHKRDGTIQNRNSFGNDPCPPKDRKP